jgi:hypothetical protein
LQAGQGLTNILGSPSYVVRRGACEAAFGQC